MSGNQKTFKLHSIQLLKVNIVELYIKSNQPPDETIGVDEVKIPFFVGHSDFDEENRKIAVMVKVEIGTADEKEENEDSPFSLRVEIVGEFKVTEKFPIEHIDNWARRNAPFILMPFLREHVYALTLRSGFKPINLPLLEVPTLTNECQS